LFNSTSLRFYLHFLDESFQTISCAQNSLKPAWREQTAELQWALRFPWHAMGMETVINLHWLTGILWGFPQLFLGLGL